MSLQLDNTDARILELLQKDGRMMYKDIAREVGISLPTVRDRINKLMELGVIRKFTVIVDSEKLWGRTRAFVLAQPVGDGVDGILEKIKNISEVRAAYLVAGEKQLLLEVEVDDLHQLGEFVAKYAHAQLGLSNASSFVITKILKEEYGAAVKPNASLQFKCDFCDCLIYGKPIIEYIGGGRYYFSGKDCAQAFKERRLHPADASPNLPK